MDRFLIVAAVAVVCGLVALWANRLRASKPIEARRQASVPAQLERDEFVDPTSPWLLVVFSSSTCAGCEDVIATATSFNHADVAMQNVEFGRDRALHERYNIDSVPTTVLVDRDGAVRAYWLGHVDSTALLAALEDSDPT